VREGDSERLLGRGRAERAREPSPNDELEAVRAKDREAKASSKRERRKVGRDARPASKAGATKKGRAGRRSAR
jgi:hypothetical protein